MIDLQWRAIEPGEGHEAGRQLLAQMYRAHRGQVLPDVVQEQWGKPRFVEDPLQFSISHTKGHVFCVLSDKAVGIDAEEKSRNIDLRLAEKILSPGERVRYEACENKREALLKLWVLKEAEAKRSGEGLRGYPNKTDFSPEDPRITEIDGCFVAVVE